MSEYQPVPVQAAREVSDAFGRDVVVIVAWQRSSNMVHITTYGRNPMDKMAAGNLGEILGKAAGCDLAQKTTFEDFRTKTVAEWAAEKDELLRNGAHRDELLSVCREQSALIEGLRNLLTFYRIGKRPTEKVLDAVQDPSQVQDRARAVIAKAEGRNSRG